MNNPIELMTHQAIDAFQSGNLDSAEKTLARVLKAQPKHLPALHILGLIKASQSKHSEAADLLKKALSLNPSDPSLSYNLAKALQECGRDKESLPHHRKAVQLASNNPSAWLNYGKSLSNLGSNLEALEIYTKALVINPIYFEAFVNIGVTFKDLGRNDEALIYADKAIALNSQEPHPWSNRGVALKELKRYDEALASYNKAIELKPDYHEAWSNRGVTLNELKRYDEALASYNKAIELKPDYFDGYWNKALTQLVNGNFDDGWKNYEYRWKKTQAEQKRYQHLPTLTNISEISGKKVLVWSEQGYGDTIQFSRFIHSLQNLNVDVTFEVQKPLLTLITKSFPDCKVVAQGESEGHFDAQVPLLSLPLMFNTNIGNIPSPKSYLNPHSISGKSLLKLGSKKLNIGIACSGNPNHRNDINRSMDLSIFKPVTQQANLFLIQKEVSKKDREFLLSHPEIQFLGDEIESFDDSASMVNEMDIVITVDTSLAHLSGSLGKPTLILLPWNPEWRWLLDRQDSPWYQTAKLFRQPTMGDWETVIREVLSYLNQFSV